MEPLASKIRPTSLDGFIGQDHLVGKGKPLRVAIEQQHVFSFVLWGPPGVGKTTLARIYANAIHGDYYELSAVSTGKDDIRRIVEIDGPSSAGTYSPQNKRRESSKDRGHTAQIAFNTSLYPSSERRGLKVLFLDEMHRFNKAQQDFLLPYVERGGLVLIGATTENPSFEVISPLLSRMRVFTLHELSPEEMGKIIDRTGIKLAADAREWLITMANGDARAAISMIENTKELYKKVTVANLTNALQDKYLRYDKKGEEHYNIISAYIKSMRAGDADAAMYYLARMVDAGEDPKFIARRMVIFASEDIGLAVPTALVVANEVFRAVETIGMPECAINLAHGTAYLASCAKNRSAYDALQEAMGDVKTHGNLPVPLKLRNAPTKLMKSLKYGKGYEKYGKESFLPEKLKGKRYLRPFQEQRPAAKRQQP